MRRLRFMAAEDCGLEKEEGISHRVSGSAPVGLPSCNEQPRPQPRGKEAALPWAVSPSPSHSLAPALAPLPSPVAARPGFPVDLDSSCEGISDQGWWDLMLTSLRSREEAAAASALPITRTSAREVMLSAPFQHPGAGQAGTGWTLSQGAGAMATENSLTL